MEAVDLTVTFGPAAQDRATLSKSCRITLETLYRHPIAHNLEWPDVIALFNHIGAVEHKSNNETSFSLDGGKHHLLRKRHGTDLTTDDVMPFRHMLSRADSAAARLASCALASCALASCALASCALDVL